MAWDFETDPEYQKKLDWADKFVREEVEPLDLAFPHLQFTPLEGKRREAIDPLKEEVRRQGLWATHLGPELGGQGYGQLKLALLNEILGRSQWAPIVFGCQAPDTGNAEIIAHYGTDEQKKQYLQPLLDGECFSSYSMTEPHAGADPTLFKTRAVKDGDEWVINGWKFFSSNAKTASFLIVMAVTNPDVSPYKGMSMFLVPTDTPGVNIVRNVGLYGEPVNEGSHALIHYEDVRVPEEALAGRRGAGLRHRADPPRRRSHPPRHAHHRHGPEGDRHDVRAGAQPRDAGQPAGRQAVRAGLHRRLVRAADPVPPLRALHGVGDRQVQRLQAGAQGHRHGQGGHADGAARHRVAGHAGARRARARPTRCRSSA